MPYRRLPKTDQARIQSLQKIIELDKENLDSVPISSRLLMQAKTYFPVFYTLVFQYNETYNAQVDENKKYQTIVRNARMYISHFIQVLNFAVLRGEIKREVKELYKLNQDDFTVPDLISEASMVEWGNNIIEGEQMRVIQGGFPLSYPTIAKVKMHFDIFNDNRVNQKTRQKSTSRNQQKVAQMRIQIDELILQIWDAVEAYYSYMLPYAKYKACKKCGLIYYYRRGEQPLTPKVDEDLRKAEEATLRIEFDEDNNFDEGDDNNNFDEEDNQENDNDQVVIIE